MLNVDLVAFAQAANWSRLPRELAAIEIHKTAEDPTFPGALLPAVAANNRIYWYAVARTPAEWRELAPLLVAYAGPTLTSFRGQPLQPDSSKPPERLLETAGVYGIGRLIPGSNDRDIKAVARALDRLRKGLKQRPPSTRQPKEALSAILGRFEFGLATGDRLGSEAALAQLRGGWRLDVINLRFLECQVFGTFRDWAGLRKQSWFDDLCAVRKPAPVALTLLHALWFLYLEPLVADSARLRDEYRKVCSARASMLLPQLPDNSDPIVAAVRALEGIPAPTQPISPSPSAAPDNWLLWLARVDDPTLVDPVELARTGAQIWPIWNDADRLGELAEALAKDPASPIGAARVQEALPCLMLWIKRDPDFPRRAAELLYQSILNRLVLLDSRGAPEREAIADLYDALLSLGISVRHYRQIIEDVSGLAAEAPGKVTIDWLLDLAAITLRYSAPDPDGRLIALNALLNSLQSVRLLLTTAQRAVYSVLAAMAGWQESPPATVPLDDKDALSALAGKSIAIYTLTESAARQASEVLRNIEPTLKIETIHDHVCTPRLENLSKTADLMVVAWSSAKHAATDCIQKHRRDRPIVYAPGRGVSSLVRIVTEYSW